MVTATLTSKGQITISKAVRDSLHLRCGDKVAFIVRESSEAVMKPMTQSVDQVFGRLRSPTGPRLTVAQMSKAIARRFESTRL